MVKISRILEIRIEDIEETYKGEDSGNKRIVFLNKRADYPVNVMYEVHIPGVEVFEGYLDESGKRILEK